MQIKTSKFFFSNLLTVFYTARLPALDLELDLDDLNLPPKEEIHSDLDISKVIMANLNSSMSADEAELVAALSPVKQMDNNENASDPAVGQQVTTTTQDKDTTAESSGTETTQNKDNDAESSGMLLLINLCPDYIKGYCVIFSGLVPFAYFSLVGDKGEEEHNVQYFRNLLSSETARYNVMCEEWETINTPELSEEGTLSSPVLNLLMINMLVGYN